MEQRHPPMKGICRSNYIHKRKVQTTYLPFLT